MIFFLVPAARGGIAPGKRADNVGKFEGDRLERLDIPRVIVGWDKDWLEVVPCSLTFWEKLSLEPYSRAKHVSYIAFIPKSVDHHLQASHFFQELSVFYEVCSKA